MKNTLGIIINNPSKELLALTSHRNPITLPFFARYRLIDFTLSNMVNSHVSKIGVIASDKYRSLLDHIGAGQEWNLSRKDQSLIILQGARKFRDINTQHINLMDFEKNSTIFDRTTEENILISSPNIVSKIDYTNIINEHKKNDADITLVATEVQDNENEKKDIFIDVDENESVKRIHIGSKNFFVKQYAGMLIIKKETMLMLLDLALDLGEYEMLTLIKNNLDILNIKCYTYNDYLRRISTIKNYFDTNMELLDIDIASKIFTKEHPIYTKIKDNHPTLYKLTCDIKSSCIASGSIVNGIIEKSILFRQVVQEKNSKITNSILMGGCHVGEGAVLDYVIADRNVVIGKNVTLKGTKDSPITLKKEMII